MSQWSRSFGGALVAVLWFAWLVSDGRAESARQLYRPSPSAAETKILDALDEPTTIEFVEQPLQDVIDFFKDQHKIEILLDQRGLDDVGLATDTPVTRTLKGLSLRAVLNLILRDLDLTYVIRDEVLLITTPEEAEEYLFTRAYRLSGLAGEPAEPDKVRYNADQIAEAIPLAVDPQSWREEGGPGSLALLDLSPGSVLVVRQSYGVHEKIVEFLDMLQGVADIEMPTPAHRKDAKQPGPRKRKR